MNWVKNGYKAGDWVEVKSETEILATLDNRGELDNMPFMAEMLSHCGQTYRVLASAHKTCDTVNHSGGRRLFDTVHLDTLRCDGSEHGKCQANCLVYWKTQWLRPISKPTDTDAANTRGQFKGSADSGLRELVQDAGMARNSSGVVRYSCQATRLFDASEPLDRFRMSQYAADIRSRNVGVREGFKTMLLAAIYNLRDIGFGYRLSVWLYEAAHKYLRGFPAPIWRGSIPKGEPTPDERLELKAGETVEVKSVAEILTTLNTTGHNRGLSFDPEMVPFCGKQFRVAERVTQIINEKSGEMMHFKNPCIVLDGVVCKGQYSKLRLMCPRRITSYWREVWLRRV